MAFQQELQKAFKPLSANGLLLNASSSASTQEA